MIERQKEAIKNYVASYNRFDVDGMMENMAENVVFENVSNGVVDMRIKGLGEFRSQAESATHYFEQRRQTVKSWEFDGARVRVEISYEAILAMDFPNGLKKGDVLEMEGESEFEFADGKIIRLVDRS